ncbi:hypothetical protein T4B_14752 [Trichinella pseudospiralis]|uniref:Uncharacterized protein n=2 Tax=Trichinella pseudospiralis TaxID=6337 RepID=A0A0V1J340_TRIPS|nr:hypothetical protein T4A_10261 [Trichinella pseudospiralis]KRY90599.1 hypothetical protein T4D_9553 [Trichinella pseudospiralis]KRZ29404.1 hypothetical protein T4B_14752 [Trichinella pseudospiralis]KRZ38510.1 hypothetical protein T4C_3288 [Trichinella pseudospiralis]
MISMTYDVEFNKNADDEIIAQERFKHLKGMLSYLCSGVIVFVMVILIVIVPHSYLYVFLDLTPLPGV